jgi:ribonucleoside-diphosphate reductase alpha chain
MVIDQSRDHLITEFGHKMLSERYCLPGETPQEMFARVAVAYSDNPDHAQRIYDYMSRHWFMPATPILLNGGTKRGLPISCFLNEVEDTMVSIAQKLFSENVWLAQKGGGIGTYWGGVRSIGEQVSNYGETSGIIPFLVCQNAQSMAISQGLLRRGSSAAYLHVSHPEILEFLDIRRPTGGDPNRKALNLHHGVVVSDSFMKAVEEGLDWELKSPHTGEVIHTLPARTIWIAILTSRIELGEPYILFIDRVNEASPLVYKMNKLQVKTSNLCSEITLATGRDHFNNQRTAVCCLSSLNLEYYDTWKHDTIFIEDVMRFLDNVLQDFIDRAPDTMAHARYAAERERSVGLGVMGLHSYFQSHLVPFGSAMAKSLNRQIFAHIDRKAREASQLLSNEKGPSLDALDVGIEERFTHKTAIAPTASISIIAGNTSPGIEPLSSNASVHKNLSGSFSVRNTYLQKELVRLGKDTSEVWASIMKNEGSVQHLDFLDDHIKDVFKTAFEIDQRWLVDLAADRQPFIDQAQSLNLFLSTDITKKDLHKIHWEAWEKGLKSLYYCRSKSIARVDTLGAAECLACQ